jgi:peptidyl-prolyl cis-trans isomerase D
VAKLLDKQEPAADEIAKNFNAMREQMIEARRNEAFGVFMSGVLSDYKKNKRIQVNAKSKVDETASM